MDREAWPAVVHGITKSQTQLSDLTELNWIAFMKKQSFSRLCYLKKKKKKQMLQDLPFLTYWSSIFLNVEGPQDVRDQSEIEKL